MLCKPTINNGYNFFLTVVTNFSKDTNELKQNWTLEKTIFWHRFSCPCIRCGLFCSSGKLQKPLSEWSKFFNSFFSVVLETINTHQEKVHGKMSLKTLFLVVQFCLREFTGALGKTCQRP